ncbi:MAG TPA: NADPH:quinone oxidoreductase family protein [Pyrinomonadaceae bacterium]|nr:NADPH:quinone oxidoreductase family protein [Pyrinomonadaceae bacterium]
MELVEVPEPVPDKFSALVRVHAAGVNFPDLLVIEGGYQVKPRLPFTPGFEAIGRVVQVGAECKGVSVGDRVVCWVNIGAFQEYLTIPAAHMFHVSPSMTDAEGAAFLVSYQTAYFALVHRAKIVAGEVLLVHGGAGALGTAAIQIGKALGATLIATVSNSEKAAACRDLLGVDHTINCSAVDFAEEVKRVTNGRGADIIIDPIGGEIFNRSLKSIAWEGRLVPIGFTSGVIPSLEVNRVLLKNISIVGLYWSTYLTHNPLLTQTAQKELNSFYEKGLVKPRVGEIFKMDELPLALAAIEDRRTSGKQVIIM